MNESQTQVRRSVGATLGWLLAAAAGGGLWVAQWASEAGAGVFAHILCGGLVAFCLLGAMVAGAKAPCPRCGRSLVGLSSGDEDALHLCDECRALLRSHQGSVSLVPETYAADAHVFAVDLVSTATSGSAGVVRSRAEGEIRIPPICAECGATATRSVPVSHRTSLGSKALMAAAGLMAGELVYADERCTVQIPHCDEHDDGALLKDEDRPSLVLRLKSYALARRYAELMGVTLRFDP